MPFVWLKAIYFLNMNTKCVVMSSMLLCYKLWVQYAAVKQLYTQRYKKKGYITLYKRLHSVTMYCCKALHYTLHYALPSRELCFNCLAISYLIIVW